LRQNHNIGCEAGVKIIARSIRALAANILHAGRRKGNGKTPSAFFADDDTTNHNPAD
jgi:hypothetical protein